MQGGGGGKHRGNPKVNKGRPQRIFKKFKKCPKPLQTFSKFLKNFSLSSKQSLSSDKNIFLKILIK